MAPSPEFMQDLWVRRILSTTGHTLLVYDYLLTLKDEVYYIWNRPWTVVKVLFLINRYGNLIGQTFIRLEEAGLLSHGSQVFCNRFTLSTSCFMFLSMESIHIIVLVRTWAIWGTQKRMASILIWSYVFYVLVLIGTAAYNATTNHTQFSQLDVTNICVRAISSHVWLICLGSFFLDTLLFALTMRSLWIYSMRFQTLHHSNLLYILVRDTIIFFIVSMLSNALRMTVLTAYSDVSLPGS
ncbi:hypothetical protein BDR07DRAFT_749369 [Suillus spraguei]|nr:hypothetical protein BDR07DRAFT_749369 [Suillus spraguei]